MQNLLDETKAAEALNVSFRTLQRMRTTGGGPRFLKIGRLVRYEADDIAAFLKVCSRQSTSEQDTSASGSSC
jgi:hypothetical protein